MESVRKVPESQKDQLCNDHLPKDSILEMYIRRKGGGSNRWFPGARDEMGIAAGGLIKQYIQRDTYPADSWDRISTTVFNV
jgi:hypothetical protein